MLDGLGGGLFTGENVLCRWRISSWVCPLSSNIRWDALGVCWKSHFTSQWRTNRSPVMGRKSMKLWHIDGSNGPKWSKRNERQFRPSERCGLILGVVLPRRSLCWFLPVDEEQDHLFNSTPSPWSFLILFFDSFSRRSSGVFSFPLKGSEGHMKWILNNSIEPNWSMEGISPWIETIEHPNGMICSDWMNSVSPRNQRSRFRPHLFIFTECGARCSLGVEGEGQFCNTPFIAVCLIIE